MSTTLAKSDTLNKVMAAGAPPGPAFVDSKDKAHVAVADPAVLDAKKGLQRRPSVLPEITPDYQEVDVPGKRKMYVRENEYIIVKGHGPVLARDILSGEFDVSAPGPPTPRGGVCACSKAALPQIVAMPPTPEKADPGPDPKAGDYVAKVGEGVFQIIQGGDGMYMTRDGKPVDLKLGLGDGVNNALEEAAEQVGDVLDDVVGEDVVDAVEDVVVEALTKVGLLKRIRNKEERLDDKIDGVGDLFTGLPGLRQTASALASIVGATGTFGNWLKPGPVLGVAAPEAPRKPSRKTSKGGE